MMISRSGRERDRNGPGSGDRDRSRQRDSDKRLNAQVMSLSIFAIGRVVPGGAAQPLGSQAAPEAAFLPATGGAAPDTGVLLGLLGAGSLLIVAGGAYLRQRSQAYVRQRSK
jgi:LPXTG-motif cell wall-anchored protein